MRASWHDKSELGQEQRICASLKRLSTSTLAHAARTSPDLKYIKFVIGEILRRKLPKPELAEIVASVAREQRAIPPLVVDCLEILRVRSPATAKALAYEFLAERPHEDRDVILGTSLSAAVECPPVELRDVRLLARALKHPFAHLRDRSEKILCQQPKGLMAAIREHLPALAAERPEDAALLSKKVRDGERFRERASRQESPVAALRMPKIPSRELPAAPASHASRTGQGVEYAPREAQSCRTGTPAEGLNGGWGALRSARYAGLSRKELQEHLASSRDSGEIVALMAELVERFHESPQHKRFLGKVTFAISDPALDRGLQERFAACYFGE